MDNPKEPPSVLSLCTGYGGLDEGISQCIGPINVLAYSEIEAYACANLCRLMEEQKIPVAPIWSDLTSLPLDPFRGKVDILTGGYPCQPFSTAGKRQGSEDDKGRHIWPYIRKAIDVIRPRSCFFENVEGHITIGLRDVLFDMGELGYRTTFGVFSAREVGAPHQRKRVFILAHAERSESKRSTGEWRPFKNKQPQETDKPTRHGGWPSRPGKPQHEWEEPRVLVNPNHKGLSRDRLLLNGDRERQIDQEEENGGDIYFGTANTDRMGGGGDDKGEDKLQMGRATDGLAHRIDRLRLLGNGVVPQTAALAWKVLSKRITGEGS